MESEENSGENRNSMIVISIICIMGSILLAGGIYYGLKKYLEGQKKPEAVLKAEPEAELNADSTEKAVQQEFIAELEKTVTTSRQRPEKLIQDVYLEYKKFFENRKNMTGITIKDILEKRFDMNLPPARRTAGIVLRDTWKNEIPKRFPNSIKEYRIQKKEEFHKLYPLVKVGDTVTIRSSLKGVHTGTFNGFGSKGASVRIGKKYYSLYDCSRESKSQFDPALNEIVCLEYVTSECDKYKENINRVAESLIHRKMRQQGYLFRGEFFSPAEYLAALEKNKGFRSVQKKRKRIVLEKAKEIELKKLPPSDGNTRFTNTTYTTSRKTRTVKTIRD